MDDVGQAPLEGAEGLGGGVADESMLADSRLRTSVAMGGLTP